MESLVYCQLMPHLRKPRVLTPLRSLRVRKERSGVSTLGLRRCSCPYTLFFALQSRSRTMIHVLTLCMLCNFSYSCCRPLTFNFQKYYHSVKQFGSRSAPDLDPICLQRLHVSGDDKSRP